MKYKKTLIGTLIVLIIGGIWLTFSLLTANQTSRPHSESGPKPTQATVFFHGYGSSRNAEKSMASYLIKNKYSNQTINVTVAKDGSVSMNRPIKAGDKNPLILVEFKNNRNTNTTVMTNWVSTIMQKLHNQGIKSVNMIGHSMGTMAIAFYLLQAEDDQDTMPKVARQISIAGVYNGVLSSAASKSALNDQGEPAKKTELFNHLNGLSTYYQTHHTKVLNIYGNSEGDEESDSTVANNSSKALRYFVQDPSTYKEIEITGKQAQHSKLHENTAVDQDILDFLQDK
ncbi:alpha/beta hydrolase [Fructobacillus ficulneus]|uniref:Cell surface hydrolase n=1 Tax=Fructobacillus ficulneus TaxID=157463 RepID=A0A0K8MID3_9LACO|nr:alpha/beta hydrolase [Fructobacillus ficulneus]GAP00316.1 cell surface hydrolase [Fructobacillus ficulneus]